QVTTRDDIDSTRKYVEGTDIPTALVADPAVFADSVFGIESRSESADTKPSSRCIGLVVTRVGCFKDNGIAFGEADQRKFWLDIISQLEARGDDYRIFTTGHFDDEIFLDSLVRHHGVPNKKAAVTLNCPEELIDELSRCDGVIAYRLHASITSFALGIPSIGVTWEIKGSDVYRSVGYPERALSSPDWDATTAMFALDGAMSEGVTKDDEFLMSVYQTLVEGLRVTVAQVSTAEPYSLSELREHLTRYSGTSRKQ